MTLNFAALLHPETILPNNSRASVTAIDYSDCGYLKLDLVSINEQSGEISGQLEHLAAPDLLINKVFKVRFIQQETGLVELQECKATRIDQGRLHFIVEQENYKRFPIKGDLETATRMFVQIQNKMSARRYEHIVFVLGAGASADLLPGGANLLREMLLECPNDKIERFIEEVFKCQKKLGLPYPSFNQVLNIIDIALDREEVLNSSYSLDKLRDLKKELIRELRQFFIDQTDLGIKNSYHELANQLKGFCESNGKISFITLNYDLFLDVALKDAFGSKSINYAYPFRTLGKEKVNDDLTVEDEKGVSEKIEIIKLHGSLNWMICPTCFEAFRFVDEELYKSLSSRKCIDDNTLLNEFLFPPTKERIDVHSHWIELQRKADQVLRKADKVVFIGFSLSDDDAHFRFKLTKHLFRHENPVYIQVVGSPKENYDITSNKTAYHYWQFFGPVDYRHIGFNEYAKSPY